MKLVFATHNSNKLKEVQKMAPVGFEVIGLAELGLEKEIPETGVTIEANSLIKAQFIYDTFKLACIADDSGLEVHALNNAPGVYSARYAGEPKDDQKNVRKLLTDLKGKENRSANFKTVITYVNPKGEVVQFTGLIEGTIAEQVRGENGFGYDPIFQPEGYHLTFAEMSHDEKNSISHRRQAFNQFITFLNTNP